MLNSRRSLSGDVSVPDSRQWKHPDHTLDNPPPAERRSTARADQALIRHTSNLLVKVSPIDWDFVALGAKQMFRFYDGRGSVIPRETPCPRPCLLYSVTHTGSYKTGNRAAHWEHCLGTLLSVSRQPLGAISDADIRKEGFANIHEFRAYWSRKYTKRGWRPWDEVTVVECRPLQPGEYANAAMRVFEQLYGEWM